jgi:hypothetical protein
MVHFKIYILLILLACFVTAIANNNNSPNSRALIAQNDTANMSTVHIGQFEQDDTASGLRSNGMIYVVVGVMLIILAGLFIYLSTLDKKIAKLENEINNRRKLS